MRWILELETCLPAIAEYPAEAKAGILNLGTWILEQELMNKIEKTEF